jgi:recombination protein RecT
MPDDTRPTEKANLPAIIRKNLDQMAPQFAMVLPAHISVEKFKRVAQTALLQSPELQRCEPRALMAACVRAAQDGLLPDGREGAIVLFKGKPMWLPMTYGLIKKMRQSGDVKSITARCVYEKDEFTYVMGDNERLEHKPFLDGDAGPLRFAYAIAHLDGGEIVREVMTRKQIDKRKAVSASGDRGPWGSWYDEMARKTVVKALAKYLPQSPELAATLERDFSMNEKAAETATIDAADLPVLAGPDEERDDFERAAEGDGGDEERAA